jgi:YD repeat-containing protein
MAGRLMDNLLKDYAGTHYKWDERGNLIERSRNGEITTFTWDGFNRMRSAETTTFSYDAPGRRIAKRTSHATTLFGWDGDTLAFESTQSTEGQQEYAWRGDSVHYIHEFGSFVPLVQIRQAKAVELNETTDVKALIAANGGSYDIEQDPLWNGEQSRTPAPFRKEEIAFYQCDHLGTPQELTDHEGRIAWSAGRSAQALRRPILTPRPTPTHSPATTSPPPAPDPRRSRACGPGASLLLPRTTRCRRHSNTTAASSAAPV